MCCTPSSRAVGHTAPSSREPLFLTRCLSSSHLSSSLTLSFRVSDHLTHQLRPLITPEERPFDYYGDYHKYRLYHWSPAHIAFSHNTPVIRDQIPPYSTPGTTSSSPSLRQCPRDSNQKRQRDGTDGLIRTQDTVPSFLPRHTRGLFAWRLHHSATGTTAYCCVAQVRSTNVDLRRILLRRAKLTSSVHRSYHSQLFRRVGFSTLWRCTLSTLIHALART